MTFAFGVACVPMVGMALGAKLAQRAKRVAWLGSLLSAVMVGGIGFVVTFWPQLWSGMYTNNPGVLANAALYFAWVGPCYAFFAFGLCLYFASQGAGKMLGPVLAGALRLLVVAVGGIWLTQNNGTTDQMFSLIAWGMVCYGVGTALAVYKVRWSV